jgi:antitoxin component of MazEF toxin-antitoxin module
MSSTITKIGNSQGVRISKAILKQLGLSVDDKVDITLCSESNRIIIEKATQEPQTIYELFDNYIDDGIREPLLLDFDDVGEEIWK